MTLKVGTFLPQNWSYDPLGSLVEVARAAEEIGYDSVWVCERNLYAEDQTGAHRLTEYGDSSWPDFYRLVIDPLVALSMDQVISDLAGLASVGVAEVVVTLPFLATSVSELRDLSAEFHAPSAVAD